MMYLEDLFRKAEELSTEERGVTNLEMTFENGENLSIPLECIYEFVYKDTKDFIIGITNKDNKITKEGLYYKDNKYNPLSRFEGKDLSIIGFETSKGFVPIIEIEFTIPVDVEMNLTKEELDYYFPQKDVAQYIEYQDYNDIYISKDKIKYYEGFTVTNKKQVNFALNKLENIHNKLKSKQN